MSKYYPIMLDIKNKKCTVVGGGKVAERKVKALIKYDAKVVVISPNVTSKIQEFYEEGKVKLIRREYEEGDLSSSFLVYAATNDDEINQLCRRESKEKGIILNVVDNPDICDFVVPANINRGDLSLSISTNGKSPMLSRKIREDLEKIYSKEYSEYVKILGEIRDEVKKEVKDIHERRKIFLKLVYSKGIDRYIRGEITDLKKELYTILEEAKGNRIYK